jgi:hypothetical protein
MFQKINFTEILNKNKIKREAFIEIVSWCFVLIRTRPFEQEANSKSRSHFKRCQRFNSEYRVRILQFCMFNNNSHFLYMFVGLLVCDSLIFIWLRIKILCQLVHEASGCTTTGRKQQISVIILTATWKRQLPQHAPNIQDDLGVTLKVYCVSLTSVSSLSTCEVVDTEVISHTASDNKAMKNKVTRTLN